MSEYVCKLQVPVDQFKNFPTPKPLMGMRNIPTSTQVGKFDYYFEDDKGKFIQMFFDVTNNDKDFFVLIKCVAVNNEILQAYINQYTEFEKKFPMKMDQFYGLDRTIVRRTIFKERSKNKVDAMLTTQEEINKAQRGNLKYAKKRKGQFVAIQEVVVEPGKENNMQD